MRAIIRRFIRDEEAASAIEYALIAGLIAAVIIGTVTLIGERIDAVFTDILNALPGGGGGGE